MVLSVMGLAAVVSLRTWGAKDRRGLGVGGVSAFALMVGVLEIGALETHAALNGIWRVTSPMAEKEAIHALGLWQHDLLSVGAWIAVACVLFACVLVVWNGMSERWHKGLSWGVVAMVGLIPISMWMHPAYLFYHTEGVWQQALIGGFEWFFCLLHGLC